MNDDYKTRSATTRVARLGAGLALAFALTTGVTGCATTDGYAAVLQTYMGASERELIANVGPPQSVYEAGGTKYLTYSSAWQGQYGGTAPSYRTTLIGNTAYSTPVGGTGPVTVTWACDTTFVIENQVVVNYSFKGNNCLANVPNA